MFIKIAGRAPALIHEPGINSESGCPGTIGPWWKII
jgi:hypothetical protein